MVGKAKRKRHNAPWHGGLGVGKAPRSIRSKVAIKRVFPSVVGINTYGVPADMVDAWNYDDTFKFAFQGHGIIIESDVIKSQVAAEDDTYLTTILAPAMLFNRTNGIKPQQVEFDVCMSDGKLYKGEVLCCDFYYNLAALRIKSESSLKPVSLMALNDVSSIDIDGTSFQIGRHSNLFKVQPGTKIIVLNTSFSTPFSFKAVSGVFSAIHRFNADCKELYWVECGNDIDSGAVINRSGDVLGILFDESAFLPSNFILRWWGHYKSKRKFCRPWVGVEAANLSEARLSILDQLKNKFSEKGIGTGVIVTKVERDTPAYRSGIRIEDVIVKCDGKQIQSKMEFFESMWDNVGNAVELTVLRSCDGQELNLSMLIEEATSTNFYKWELPFILAYG